MPTIGEIKKDSEVGNKGTGKLIWQACADCGKERWVRLKRGKAISLRCQFCGGKYTGRLVGKKNWKGGRCIVGRGYVAIYLAHDDFFISMAGLNGYVFEHRLVVAKALGRCLHRWEIVHHKHDKYPAGSVEDKQDNRIENLQLISEGGHQHITILENRIRHLEQRVLILKAENILLKRGED